jgi:hypothetical protein
VVRAGSIPQQSCNRQLFPAILGLKQDYSWRKEVPASRTSTEKARQETGEKTGQETGQETNHG